MAYACPTHYDQVMSSLADEYGSAVNCYDVDDLAMNVTVDMQRRFANQVNDETDA